MRYLNSTYTSVLNIKAASEQTTDVLDWTLRKSRPVLSWNPKPEFVLEIT